MGIYRHATGPPATDQFLGRFQLVGPTPTDANISVLCVIIDEQVLLCARDNTSEAFVEIRRTEE